MDCKAYEKCGACGLLRVEYCRQLEEKRVEVERAFGAYGHKIKVHEVVGMEDSWHYRNKVIAYVTMQAGRVVCGMYEESSHRVVPTPDCLLQNETLNAVLADITSELNALHIRPEGFGGVLKDILLRIAVATGQVMVVFVTSEEMFHGRNELVKRITGRHREVRTVVQNVNPRRTSVILGEREMVLYGSGYIYDELLGYRFKISPRSFYQVNPLQCRRLYSKALELADIRDGESVFDAYCGIGTIGISASDRASYVLGVEINPDAVDDARANARANKLRNVEFVCADVTEFMRWLDGCPDVLVVDPPRSGCDEAFLSAVLKMSPGRIVYISCDPHTQARDLARLSKSYGFGDAFPVDMFPHTKHIENVVLLTRRS